MTSKKQIAKNSLYMYIRMLFNLIISLYTVRVVLNTLGVVDYGLFSAVGGVISSLALVSSVLSNASLRFFSFYIGENEKKLNEVFSAIIIVYMAVALFCVLIMELLGPWFIETHMTVPTNRDVAVSIVYHFMVISFFFGLIGNPFQALILSHEDMNTFALISILETLSKLVVVLIVTVLNYDKLILYSILLAVQTSFFACLYLIYTKRYEITFTNRIHRHTFVSIFNYSSWTLFGGVAGVMNMQGMNVLLNVFWGPVVNAAFSIGNQVSNMVQLFSSNFFSAIRPPLIKSFASQNKQYSFLLFKESSKALFILLFILVVIMFLECPKLLVIWLGQVNNEIVVFVRLMLIYTFVICQNNPLTTIAQASGEVKRYHGIVDSFLASSIIVVYFLFKKGYDSEYAIYCSITFAAITHVFRMYIVSDILGYPMRTYLREILLPCFFAGSLAVLIALFINNYFDFGFIGLCLRLVFYLFSSSLIFYAISLNRNERNLCNRFCAGLIKKWKDYE